uniref:Sp4 transcription factor n=1 Tax=Sinocyclocheilus rhinocerous TaxID=307959 RepID=A0A673M5Z8_9TELE
MTGTDCAFSCCLVTDDILPKYPFTLSTAESTCATASDAVADAMTLSTGAESQKDSQAGESDAQNLTQSNGLQSASEQSGQIQQFQIVGHPVLQQIQIQSPQQQVVQGSIQTLQPVQQNLQLQAFQNPTQVLIRTPTLTPSGQISWQTVQVQNAGVPQQLTLAPVVSSSSGGTFTQMAPLTLGGSPIMLSAAQLPSGTGVQTVNITGLGAAGVQVQGVPLTITGIQGKPLPPKTAAVRNLFCVQNFQNLYNKQVHHESIFQTVSLACPESLWYTYNKCLYSDYFRLVRVGTAAEYRAA